jgi:hypothetical protein
MQRFAQIRGKIKRGFGCLQRLFPEGVCRLKDAREVAVRINV